MNQPFDNEACYYDLFHQDKDYKSEARAIRHRFPRAKTVLEIGCGTGNLTWELNFLGFEVICIEPSLKMLNHFKGGAKVIPCTIQAYRRPSGKFDLILATYDVLNYIPFHEIGAILTKIDRMGNDVYIEYWHPLASVRPVTYKRVDNCHRLRLGFKLGRIIHLWFIFWGQGLVLSHHKLYLHRFPP